jgi:uncharacterized protein
MAAPPQPHGTPEPARRLAPRARWVWAAQWAGGCAVALVAGSLVARGTGGVPDVLLWGLPLAALALGTPVVPGLVWRRWRWDVREAEVDVRRGIVTVRRTLIPMLRVQHVETTRGVMEQALGLATVRIHTAAGSHTIPLLTVSDAARVRDRIAELARTEQEDVRGTAGEPGPVAKPARTEDDG